MRNRGQEIGNDAPRTKPCYGLAEAAEAAVTEVEAATEYRYSVGQGKPVRVPSRAEEFAVIGVIPNASGTSDAGSPRIDANIRNLVSGLRSGCLGTVRFDEFTGAKVLENNDNRVPLDDPEITRLLVNLQHLGFGKVNRSCFRDAVDLVAKDNSFDSAQEWLGRLPAWDGIRRVERFLPDYLGSLSRPYELAVGRYLWTAVVARILFPGCKADMVPVLIGPQGVGKSTVLSVIAPTPEHYGEACLSDRSSDLARKVLGKTMVAWKEMRGIRGKCDADEVKTFITSTYIETRSRTKAGMDRHDRRFILVGTANGKEILRDPTGNRRYLPFDVPRRIAIDKVEADKLQLWAEALQLVKDRVARGENGVDFQDAERLAENEYATYFNEARWAGEKRLLGWLERCSDRFSTEEALDAIGLLPVQISQREKRDMATTLRQLGYGQRSSRVPGMKNPQMRWHKS